MPREDRLTPPAWPGGRTEPPNGAFSTIGRRNRKLEGLAKVTGQAIYADDLVLPRMLHAKLLRSPARARAHRLDRRVRGARDAGCPRGDHRQDLPEYFGIIPWTQDEQALCEEKARYVGDAVAAVAADTERLAEEALRGIRVEYEPLPAVMDVETAAAHPEWQVNEKASEGNLSKHVHLDFGDVEGGLAASDVVIEDEYFYEGSTHTPIEPHCALAHWDPTGFLTLWSSTPGRALPAPRPREGARPADPADPRDPAGRGGRVRRQERAVLARVLRGQAQHDHGSAGEDPLHARRGVLRAPRASSDALRYRTGATRWQADGGRRDDRDRRRRVLVVRARDHLLLGPAAHGAVRDAAPTASTRRAGSRTSRAAAPSAGTARCQPRFAFECQLDQIADGSASTRSSCGAATSSARHAHGERHARHFERVPRLPGAGREGVGLGGEVPRHAVRPRACGVAGSMYISGTNYCIYPNEMPQSAVQLKLDRSGRATVFCGISDIGQGASRCSRTSCARTGARAARRARGRGRHRPHAGRPRQLLEPRDVHVWQRVPRRRAPPAPEDRAGARRHVGLRAPTSALANGVACDCATRSSTR
jgi:hypothetical protein